MEIHYSSDALKREITKILKETQKDRKLKVYKSRFEIYVGDRRNWLLRKTFLRVYVTNNVHTGKRKIFVVSTIPSWNRKARILGKKMEVTCREDVEVREA